MKQTIKAYRVTFLVDEDAFEFLAKAHGYNEDNELWIWENTEEVQHEQESCDDCGSISMMHDYPCPNAEGICMDCCDCLESEHTFEGDNL